MQSVQCGNVHERNVIHIYATSGVGSTVHSLYLIHMLFVKVPLYLYIYRARYAYTFITDIKISVMKRMKVWGYRVQKHSVD